MPINSQKGLWQIEKTKRVQVAAKIKFDFKESAHFRIVHVDGAFGGPTPHGLLYMSLFNEHNPMPSRVVHSIDGPQLGSELMEERVCDDALVRTNEVAVLMNFETAKVVRDWLTRQIEDAEKRTAIANSVSVGEETKH